MKRRKVHTITAGSLVVACSFGLLLGCSSDRSTVGREQDMSFRAAEAEREEAELAELSSFAKARESYDEANKGSKNKGEAQKTADSKKKPKASGANKHAKADAEKVQKSPKGEPTRKPASARANGSVYVVQIGAFKVKENAAKLEAKLKASGYPVIVRPKGDLHLVRLEPTNNKAEAQVMIETLKNKEDIQAVMIALPNRGG